MASTESRRAGWPFAQRRPKQRHSSATLQRSLQLFKSFRVEQSDPDRFYSHLAADSVEQIRLYTDLANAVVVDVGGGPGYFADAFDRLGATYIPLDADAGELRLHGRQPAANTVMGDGTALPFATTSVDVCYSSNVAEHVERPWDMANEMVRIVKPGGWVFLSYTLWYGPWGGHETAPWHYFGGRYAARRYSRKHGHPPKNNFNESMFRTTAQEGLAWARGQQDAVLVDSFPRYLPQWSWPVAMLPGVREVAAWNLLLVLRKL